MTVGCAGVLVSGYVPCGRCVVIAAVKRVRSIRERMRSPCVRLCTGGPADSGSGEVRGRESVRVCEHARFGERGREIESERVGER